MFGPKFFACYVNSTKLRFVHHKTADTPLISDRPFIYTGEATCLCTPDMRVYICFTRTAGFKGFEHFLEGSYLTELRFRVLPSAYKMCGSFVALQPTCVNSL